MKRLISLSLAIGVLTFGATAARPVHATTDLAELGYYQSTDKLKTTKIASKLGADKSPFAGQAKMVWVLSPPKPVAAARAPEERRIELYRQFNGHPQLICTIAVKYFRAGDRWQAHYRILERFSLLNQGDEWVPIPQHTGHLAVIPLRATQFPNEEGYYTSLHFGVPNQAISIDAWIVKDVPNRP